MNGAVFPAVRLRDFTNAFGPDGLFLPACHDSYAPQLADFAREIGAHLGAQCLKGVLLDRDPAAPGLQPDCSVVDRTPTAAGVVETPLPPCDGAAPPCWRLRENPAQCDVSGLELVIDRGGTPAPPGTVATVRCATCADPADPRCASGG